MAAQIKDFSISHLTVGSTSDFHTKVNALIDTATAAALHIDALAPAYKTAAETLASVVNRRTAYVSTAQLKESDERRDDGYAGVLRFDLSQPQRRHLARKCRLCVFHPDMGRHPGHRHRIFPARRGA